MKLRPRFSVRTLTIVMTLVCAYFGAWEGTTRYGLPFDTGYLGPAGSPMPFVIVHENYVAPSQSRKQYHLWLLGPTVKLPFELETK